MPCSTHRALRVLRLEQHVHSLSFAPDGRTLAIAAGAQVLLWEWDAPYVRQAIAKVRMSLDGFYRRVWYPCSLLRPAC
jgi:hypothetical protein